MSTSSGTGREGEDLKPAARCSTPLARTTRSRSSGGRSGAPVRLTRSSIFHHTSFFKQEIKSETTSEDLEFDRASEPPSEKEPPLAECGTSTSDVHSSTPLYLQLEENEANESKDSEDDEGSCDSIEAVSETLTTTSDIMPLKDLQKQREECSSVTSNSDLDQPQPTLSKSDAHRELVAQIDEMAGKEDKKKVLELMSLNFNSSADVEKAKELICETLAAKEKKATTRKSKKRRLELLLALAESSDASSSKDGNAKYPLLKTNPITHALKRVRKEPITSPPSSVTSPTSIIATTSAFLSLASPSLSFTGLTSKSTTPSLRSLKSLTSSSANSSVSATPDVCTSTQSLPSSSVPSIAVASVPALKRVRRGNRRSASEKDSSEDTTSLSEASEAESNKTEESANLKKKSKTKSKKTSNLVESADSSIATPSESDADTLSSVELSGKKLSISSGKGGRGRGRGRGKAIDLILFGSSPDLPVKGSSIGRLKSRSRLSLPYITPGSEMSKVVERDASPSSDDISLTVSKKSNVTVQRTEPLSQSFEAKKIVAVSRRKQKQAKQDKGTVTNVTSIKSDSLTEDDEIKEPPPLRNNNVNENPLLSGADDDLPDITVPILSKKKTVELESDKRREKIARKKVQVKHLRKAASSSDVAKQKKKAVKTPEKVPAAIEDPGLSRGRKRKSHASLLEDDELICTRRSRSSTPVNILANNNKPPEVSRLAKKKPVVKDSNIDMNTSVRGAVAVEKEEITHEVLEAKHEDDIPLHSTEITAVGDDCILKNSTIETEINLEAKPLATSTESLENETELPNIESKPLESENNLPEAKGEDLGAVDKLVGDEEPKHDETEAKRLISEVEEDVDSSASSSAKPTPVVATKRKKRHFRGLKYSFSSGADRKRKLAREARKAAEAAVEHSTSLPITAEEINATVKLSTESSLALGNISEKNDENANGDDVTTKETSVDVSDTDTGRSPAKVVLSAHPNVSNMPLVDDTSTSEKVNEISESTLNTMKQPMVLSDSVEPHSGISIVTSASESTSLKTIIPLRRSMSVDEGTKIKTDQSSAPDAAPFVAGAHDNKASTEGHFMDASLLGSNDNLVSSKDSCVKNAEAVPSASISGDKKGESLVSHSTSVSVTCAAKDSQKTPVPQSPDGSHRRLSLQEPATSHLSATSITRSPIKQPTVDFLRSLSLIRTEDVKSIREEALKKSENRPKIDIQSLTAALNKKKKPIKLKRNNEVGRQSSLEKKADGNETENPYTFVASPPKPVSLRTREAVSADTSVEDVPAVVMRSTRRKACAGGRRRLEMSLTDPEKASQETPTTLRRPNDTTRLDTVRESSETSACLTRTSHNQVVTRPENSASTVLNVESDASLKDESKYVGPSNERALSDPNSIAVSTPNTAEVSSLATQSAGDTAENPSVVKPSGYEGNETSEKLSASAISSVTNSTNIEQPGTIVETDESRMPVPMDTENTQSHSMNISDTQALKSDPQPELSLAASEDAGVLSGRASSGPSNASFSASSRSVQPTGSVIVEGGVRKSRRIGKLHAGPQLPQPLAIAAPLVSDQPPEQESQEFEDVACESLRQVLCKCRVHQNPIASLPGGPIYCQAIDSFDGRMLGCCNIVKRNTYLRVSGKIPFLLLCDIHRHRLRRHNCCPGCGLFCTQGVFLECRWSKGLTHHYHRLCGLPSPSGDSSLLCPHCGASDPPAEVLLDLKLARKPVVYLEQHQEKKTSSGARITWNNKRELSPGASLEDTGPELELGEGGKVVSAGKLAPSLDRDKLEAAIISVAAGKPPNIKCTPKSLYWATKHGDLEKVLQVLAGGVNPNSRLKDSQNQTGLHMAAAMGNVAITHVLVMVGAALDLTDANLFTPLMIAVQKHHNNVVHYLVAAGAELQIKTNEGMTCLHLAAKLGNLTACRHLLDSGRLSRHAINMQDEGGWTPLVWGSENRHIAVVKFLLERGANAQLCDVEQNTALHWAALSGCTRICAMLLDRGCSLHSMNAYRDTPLHIAARQNHRDAVVLLLARGATLDCLNTKGQTPLECALPDTEVYLQLTLNQKLRQMMHDKKHRSNTVLSSDIAAGKEQVPIPCINGVDDEKLPRNYLYIAENTEAPNINIDRSINSLKWCQCTDGCNSGDCGCTQLNFRCWYDPEGRLLPDFNYLDPPMIFECNRACGCNKLSCNNRVVQHGITAHLQLFRTTNKGWGVRALKRILKGSYVCEYVGEIITDLEADQRQDDSYLFDLDNRDSETFCLDARNYGNVARFINHLCAPNLTPVKVFLDHQDLAFPRIALYASRDIEAEEELGFDYGEKFWMIKYKEFTCTCGGETCRYSSTTIHATLEKYRARLLEVGGCGTSSSSERRPSSGESSSST